MPAKEYQELCALWREASTLNSVGSLLGWDQETYMPDRAAPARAEQSALIARLTHERRTSPRVGDLLAACESDKSLDENARANVREMRRDYDHATKLPADLVAELAKTASESQQVWKEARQKSDFAMFRPALEKMMTLSRRKAECYGVRGGGELYDALMEEYEPGANAREIEAILTPLRAELAGLIRAVGEKTGKRGKGAVKIDTRCLGERIEPAAQHEFGQRVLKAMGFELDAGRLDTTTHPFCSGIAPGDTRLTTRYRDERFTDALYGTMHEGGHGLYEQGLPKESKDGASGTPLAEAVSLGIHESQSRMWENFVGRSRDFWKWALPLLRKHVGKKFAKYDVDQFYAATNTVTPSLIRVEADEGTYNMHVMIRFEIERALINGAVAPRNVPELWNQKYKEYLGVDVPDDRRGCLQDVHWSFGLVGYFPTYTLGNLYAAQLWETILKDMPDLPKRIAKGDMVPLRDWLRTKIHRHGRKYRASELCERVTGRPVESGPLLRHLRAKAEAVYGV